MANLWKLRFLRGAVVALIVTCAAGCELFSNEFVAENEQIPSEQVAELQGPFVSADLVVERDTNSPLLVTCSEDGIIRTFDMQGHEKQQWKIDAPIGQVLVFTVSTRADAYAAMDHNHVVVFGRLSRAETIARGKAKIRYNRLAFSHDGKWLAAVTDDAGQVWQTADWSECPAFLREDGVSRRVKDTVAILKDGDDALLATAGFHNDFIDLLALPSGTTVRTLRGDKGLDKRFMDLATTPDSRFLVAVTTASLNLAVWDIATGEIVARPKAFPTGIGNRLAISEDGKTLVCSQLLHSSRSRSAFRVYRVNGWTEAGLVEVKDDAPESEWKNLYIRHLSIDSTGSTVATLHGGGQVRLWQVPAK